MNKRKNLKKIIHQKGQAVLLVLLGMAAVLTLALSVASRSVTDISTVSRSENSSRAFSAAEEGVETLLFDSSINSYDVGTEIEASAEKYGEGEQSVIFDSIKAGESDTVWFVSHDSNNNLTCTSPAPCFDGSDVTFYWGKGNENPKPAIEISFYYDTSGDALGSSSDFSGVEVARATYDPDSSRTDNNKFTLANIGDYMIAGENFKYQANVMLDSVINNYSNVRLLFARVRVIYNDNEGTKIGVKIDIGSIFPAQGRKIESMGTISDAARKIEVIQYYREPLDIFETAIMSFGGNAELK